MQSSKVLTNLEIENLRILIFSRIRDRIVRLPQNLSAVLIFWSKKSLDLTVNDFLIALKQHREIIILCIFVFA